MTRTSPFGSYVWRKSSYSQGLDQNCVELAKADGLVGVRDSKDPEGVPLMLTLAEFQSFVAAVQEGRNLRP
ncbi:DUF397 domain-containing protein [Actinomadura viridis]|uniref:DUF397 domain-containing protein n=1 Tax=Actinomadura viridis TaxID=58110 RepID=UPI0036B297FB